MTFFFIAYVRAAPEPQNTQILFENPQLENVEFDFTG